MRIIQYNDTYEKVGGTETYIGDLLHHLQAQGHSVFWFAHGNDAPRQTNHILLPPSKTRLETFQSKYFFNTKKYKIIKQQLAEYRPDVIHIHHNRYHTYELFRALEELCIPTVQTIHDYTILCPSQYYPQAYFKNSKPCKMGEGCAVECSQNTCVPLQRRMFYPWLHDKKRTIVRQKIATFIAPTQKIKTFLERAQFQNVELLPFYIDSTLWSFDSQRTVQHTILFVGRVEINKGIYHLIDAVQSIYGSGKKIQLNIIGKGTQVEPIRQKIQSKNLHFIHLKGLVPHHKIQQHFAQANICVVPTLDMEQFGLVGIEALAAGTAIIGSNRGGIPDWCIHQKTGLLFEPNIAGDLEKQLLALLENDTLRIQYVQQGMQMIRKKYTLQAHFEQLLHIYKAAQPLQAS